MKRFLSLALILFCAALAPLACTHSPLPVVPTNLPTPTFTPTVTFTPSCGFTALAYPSVPYPTFNMVTAGNYVIQNASQWTAINPNAAVPAVNFNQQMILEVAQIDNVSCMCSSVKLVITSVCFYADHIEVDYANAGALCPTPTPGGPVCNSLLILPMQSLALVPLSNLPITWVGH